MARKRKTCGTPKKERIEMNCSTNHVPNAKTIAAINEDMRSAVRYVSANQVIKALNA
jgi:hypothetical protein